MEIKTSRGLTVGLLSEKDLGIDKKPEEKKKAVKKPKK